MTDTELLNNLLDRLKLARVSALRDCDFKAICLLDSIIDYIERNRTKCD